MNTWSARSLVKCATAGECAEWELRLEYNSYLVAINAVGAERYSKDQADETSICHPSVGQDRSSQTYGSDYYPCSSFVNNSFDASELGES